MSFHGEELAWDLDILADRAVKLCLARGWKIDWSARGCYLHLEASELIEALRGKGKDAPAVEAGDVLFVLLSIMGAYRVPAADVLAAMERKMAKVASGEIGAGPGL